MANIVDQKDLHRIVLTAIIYNQEKKFLFIKRSPTAKVYPNKWEVPGGGVEAKDYIETPKTTDDAWYGVIEKVLKREVKEETNLEIKNATFLLDLIFIRPDGIPVLVLSYHAEATTHNIILEEGGATEYMWATLEEAQKLDLIPGLLGEVEKVYTIISNR